MDFSPLFFTVVIPHTGSSFAEQAQEVLGAVGRFVEEEDSPVSLVGQSVFLADFRQRAVYRRMMSEFLGKQLPSTTFIAQRPCGGKRLAVELWGLRRDRSQAEIERPDDGAVGVRCRGIELVQLAHRHRIAAGQSVHAAALAAYRAIDRRLAKFGLSFDDVVRTWFYLGEITAPDGPTSRYEQLNRARSEYYRGRKFAANLLPQGCGGPAYPASTGVGAEGNDLTVTCLAVAADRSAVSLYPMENPLQTPAYEYDPQFGDEPPKFVRAMTAVTGDRAVAFISGTASITTSDSRHLGSVEQQTRQTLDNVAALISSENFRRHGLPRFEATLRDLVCVRVYLKRADDYERASAICRERLGDLPALFVVCDLCRPELLVEIEGVAFSEKRGGKVDGCNY